MHLSRSATLTSFNRVICMGSHKCQYEIPTLQDGDFFINIVTVRIMLQK